MSDLEFLNFNANDEDTSNTVPAGTYVAFMVSHEWKENSKHTGRYLSLKWQIASGPHEKRNVFSMLNLDNPNPDAVKIARRELALICKATGVMTPKQTEELYNIPICITVITEEYNGDTRNKVKNYKSCNVSQPPVSRAPGKMPWEKGAYAPPAQPAGNDEDLPF
jgi:hypothetical protein